jgi:hypothetical protein
MNKIFDKISSFFCKIFTAVKDTGKNGAKWIGTDGIITMETSALLVLFLMIFFTPMWSMAFSFVIVSGKCLIDRKRGSHKEKHDFICALVGVVMGVILGAAMLCINLI